MNTLARIVACREALEDGDTGLAYAVLTDLEHNLAGEECARPCTPPTSTIVDVRCPDCSATFRWPGELDHHQRFVHWSEAA